MMKELVKDRVVQVAKELFGEEAEGAVERATFEKPKRKEFGDFATNAAFLLSRVAKMPPKEVAQKLAEALSSFEEFEKVEVAGNGFINFFFSPSVYGQLLKKVVETDFYLSNVGKGERVLLEYVSANPTGPLHVGHGRGALVGDVLYRVMKLTGYRPEREFYVNDAGRQIRLLGLSLLYRMRELAGEEVELPDDAYRGEYLIDLAKELLEKRPEILRLPEEEAVELAARYGKERLLEEIKKDLKELRVEFDNWFSEEALHREGKVEEALNLLKEKGLIYEKDGALWLKTTQFGDDKDRVVRRSTGEYTYFAADIAYHYDKLKRGYDKAIDVWGADHHGYVPRVKAAIQALGGSPDWLEVVLIQLVKVFKEGKEVKMSKRAGTFVPLRWLMEQVGTDAVRFFFLTKRHDTPLDFDVDLALSKKSENPVYYVQYAHARLCSVLDKAREEGFEPESSHLHLLSSEEEKELIAKCYQLKSELQQVAKKREPHRLTYYLIELAGALHRFYNKHRVVNGEEPELTKARLYLIEGVRKTLAVGLQILNVNAPRRM
jgi:arginyl-tRNA synthetase